MERKQKDIKVQMVNSFRSVEHTTVYGYLNATITSIIRGDTQFKTEYLLGQVDGRSSRAVLHCGTLVKGDMILFNIDHHGQRALGEVLGLLQASPPLIHVTVFKPCNRTGHRLWDISQPTETIILSLIHI